MGAVIDQFGAVTLFVSAELIVCTSPPYTVIDDEDLYPNMYPVLLEVSMNSCEACHFGNHYSSTEHDARRGTTTGDPAISLHNTQ